MVPVSPGQESRGDGQVMSPVYPHRSPGENESGFELHRRLSHHFSLCSRCGRGPCNPFVHAGPCSGLPDSNHPPSPADSASLEHLAGGQHSSTVQTWSTMPAAIAGDLLV